MLEKIYWVAAVIGGTFLFFLSFLITADILVRWLYGRPFVGVFEASEVIFLVSTFLAAGLVQHTGRQMRVEILVSRIKGKGRYFFDALADLLALAFFLVLLWEGSTEWLEAWQGHFVRRGMIEIPNTIHLGFLIFGALSLCSSFLIGVLVSIRRMVLPHSAVEVDSSAGN